MRGCYRGERRAASGKRDGWTRISFLINCIGERCVASNLAKKGSEVTPEVMFYPCLLVPCHLATFIPRVQGVTQIWFLEIAVPEYILQPANSRGHLRMRQRVGGSTRLAHSFLAGAMQQLQGEFQFVFTFFVGGGFHHECPVWSPPMFSRGAKDQLDKMFTIFIGLCQCS